MWQKSVVDPLKFNMQKEHYVGDVRHLIWIDDTDWPESLDYDKIRATLEAMLPRIETALKPGDSVYSELRKERPEFGIGVGDYTGVTELILDKVSKHWLVLTSERNSYQQTAELSTKSLSDALTFFLIRCGLWPEGLEFLASCSTPEQTDQGKYFDRFESLNATISNLGCEVTLSDGALTSGMYRLFSVQNNFCISNERTARMCWIEEFSLASKCMLICCFDKQILAADEHSLFATR
ncbi:MAG: hypothetical protein ABJO09_04075 [Hyphomicrobiales bacterium]|uniref:hypothetical protein n=1 Tax=Nisaea sp. TaxID=2024842 RepID=UPI00327C7D15